MAMGPAKGCGAGGSVWRRLSVVRKSEAQADGTWVDTRTTTPTPTRSATISANAVGVYRGIFLRAASGTLTAPSFMNIGTRTFMRIFIYEEDATGRPPADFSPQTLSARNTEEERRSSAVDPVGWQWVRRRAIAVAVTEGYKDMAKGRLSKAPRDAA